MHQQVRDASSERQLGLHVGNSRGVRFNRKGIRLR
jgi:hypothetical protein